MIASSAFASSDRRRAADHKADERSKPSDSRCVAWASARVRRRQPRSQCEVLPSTVRTYLTSIENSKRWQSAVKRLAHVCRYPAMGATQLPCCAADVRTCTVSSFFDFGAELEQSAIESNFWPSITNMRRNGACSIGKCSSRPCSQNGYHVFSKLQPPPKAL